MFGDKGYTQAHPWLHTPYAGAPPAGTPAANFNRAMAKLREPVEWPFGNLIAKFPHLCLRRNCQLLKSGAQVGATHRVAALLLNCINCIQPQEVSQFFDCKPPKLEDYLA